MKEMSQGPVSDLNQLEKKPLFFVWFGEIWNFLEAAVALIGFGFDSILELAAGGILIWRLQPTWEDHDEENTAERKAHKLGHHFSHTGRLHLYSIRGNAHWLFS